MGYIFSPSGRDHGVRKVVRMARKVDVENPEILESPMGEEGGIRDHNGPIGDHGHVEDEDRGDEDGDVGDELIDCRPELRK